MVKERAMLFVGLVMLFSCVPGCRGDEKSSVLLRYSPEIDRTYVYTADLVGYAQVTGELTVLREEHDRYHVAFSGPLFGEMHSGTMDITDRHNSNHPGYISLNFPDDPVTVGEEWQGEIPWYFEHYFVLDEAPITVPASYKLLDIKQGEKGRYAVLQQTVEVDVVVDELAFHIGQLGVQWDGEGTITKVDEGYDAFEKLMVGDVVVGINGQDARAEQDRNRLAEEYIQHPKGDRIVSVTILRNGRELTVDVEKSIDELALVRVGNMRGLTRVEFDVDRGLLLLAEVSISQDVEFTPPSEAGFPIVDSYGGYSKFGYLEGLTVYAESYGGGGVAWTLTLEE